MSEEEKKAIETIQNYNNKKAVDLSLYFVDVSNASKIILNLIEKQSKEIEKLKENNKQKYYHVVKSNELEEEINNAWVNKINEKIEEYEEILDSPIIKEDYKLEVQHIIRILKELKVE